MNKTVMGTFSVKGVDVLAEKDEAEKKASEILETSKDKLFAIKNDKYGYLFRTTSDKDKLGKSISAISEKFTIIPPEEVATILNQFFIGKEDKNIYDAAMINKLIKEDGSEGQFDNILSLLSEESLLNIESFLCNNR
jgi:hypothetical protein